MRTRRWCATALAGIVLVVVVDLGADAERDSERPSVVRLTSGVVQPSISVQELVREAVPMEVFGDEPAAEFDPAGPEDSSDAWESSPTNLRSSVSRALKRNGGYRMAREPNDAETRRLNEIFQSIGVETQRAIRATTNRVTEILEARVASGQGVETYDLPSGPSARADRKKLIHELMQARAPEERISVRFVGHKLYIVRVYPGDDAELDALRAQASALEADLALAYGSVLAPILVLR